MCRVADVGIGISHHAIHICVPHIYNHTPTTPNHPNHHHRELHIKEDERHGRWMLEAVALPLVDMWVAVCSVCRAQCARFQYA